MIPALPRPVTWSLKAALAAAAVYLVLRKVPFASVWPTMLQCNVGYLGLVVALQLLSSVANAFRWKLLLRGSDLPLHKILYFVFLGLFVSLFMPNNVASEAVKVLAFGRKYGGTQENVGIALLSKAEGMILQLMMGAIGLVVYFDELLARGAFARLHLDGSVAAWAAAVAASIAFLAWWLRRRWWGRTWARTILELAGDRKLLLQTFFLSSVIQLLSAASIYCLILCVYPEAQFWQIVLFSTIVMAVLILPFGFGGVGVREYLNLLLFTDIGGIPANIILAASILSYIPLLLQAMIGGAWMAFRKLRS